MFPEAERFGVGAQPSEAVGHVVHAVGVRGEVFDGQVARRQARDGRGRIDFATGLHVARAEEISMAMPASRRAVRQRRICAALSALASQMWNCSTEKILIRSGWAAILNRPERIMASQAVK